MFKAKKNLRRNAKHKEQKSTKKSSPYVEDYNEIILNDLVDENKPSNEIDVQEEPIRKTKKKGISLNLGNKKKSTSNEDKDRKRKTSNKKHKNDNDKPKEIIDTESKKEVAEVEAKPQENHPTKSTKTKKHSAESKKASKKKSKNQPSEESSTKSKSSKKSSKKENRPKKEEKTKKSPKKSRKEEELKTKSIEDIGIEEVEAVEEVNDEEEIIEGSIFRNMEPEESEVKEGNIEIEEKEKLSEHKFDDIIWSDDKFPKD